MSLTKTSFAELKKRELDEVTRLLEEQETVTVVEGSQPAAYLVSPRLYERLIESAEMLEDITDMQQALEDYRRGEAVEAEEIFQRLEL
jgi:PHD/YefM family antitoxin component YafN of YafNO toxin-antitoxin module